MEIGLFRDGDMESAIERFLSYLEVVRHLSPHTLRNYRLDLRAFCAFLKEKEPSLDRISKHLIRDYLAYLRMRGLSKKTVVRHFSAMRSFFGYLKRKRLIASDPMEGVERPKLAQPLPPILSYRQIEKLFAQPDTHRFLGLRDRAIMELFYSSAMRVAELAGLNRADFDPRTPALRVRGKGRKERLLPLTQNAVVWVERYLHHPARCEEGKPWRQKDPEALFLNRWGERLTTRSIDRLFAKYRLSSGLAGRVTPHVIRHTIATHLLDMGMDIKTIQVLLGHSSLMSTTIYTRVSIDVKRASYERFHARAKRGKKLNLSEGG